MQLQKYRPKIALMPRIGQPLTQIHFIPAQLFLVNVDDITYGHSNAAITAASSTPFRVVVQPEKVQIFAARLSTIWHVALTCYRTVQFQK
jgi:hypothetical protein